MRGRRTLVEIAMLVIGRGGRGFHALSRSTNIALAARVQRRSGGRSLRACAAAVARVRSLFRASERLANALHDGVPAPAIRALERWIAAGHRWADEEARALALSAALRSTR